MKPETNNNSIDELIQAVDENTIETNSILEHSLQLKSKDSQVLEQQLETGDKTHLEVKNGFESVTKTIEDLSTSLSTRKIDLGMSIEINGDDIVYYKGEKGNPGEKPSEEELLNLIKPLIPEPIPGEKGDNGKDPTKDELLALIEPLIPEPIKGDPGNDYILTEKDKAEIASTIEIPIVEKVIEKTEVIKEVTKKVDPKKLKKDIEELGIDYDKLSNLPNLDQLFSVAKSQSSKTVSLTELDDIDYSGLSIVNNKYVLGGAGLSDEFETVSKNLKAYPYVINYTIGGDVDFITYDLGSGLSVIKTFGYTSGDITSLTLSGDIPEGIDTVKTISYVGGNVDNIVYS